MDTVAGNYPSSGAGFLLDAETEGVDALSHILPEPMIPGQGSPAKQIMTPNHARAKGPSIQHYGTSIIPPGFAGAVQT